MIKEQITYLSKRFYARYFIERPSIVNMKYM
jgi:hypothetical protein